jgi:hypothetical protein
MTEWINYHIYVGRKEILTQMELVENLEVKRI